MMSVAASAADLGFIAFLNHVCGLRRGCFCVELVGIFLSHVCGLKVFSGIRRLFKKIGRAVLTQTVSTARPHLTIGYDFLRT